ncbi:MAG TPA: LamG domain-containing protein [Chiayiivirga sp.]|nr:LamG domain-containing protein [Chiayiivirga sp.]
MSIARGSLLTVALMTTGAQAVVTTNNHWRLGEADAGAVNAGAGAASTVDGVGGFNLSRTGSPTYTALTPAGIGSSLAMALDGSGAQYQNTSGVASGLTDNFGVEAWVKSNGNVTGNAAIVYNGNSSVSGWGLYRAGGTWAMLYGGVVLGGTEPVTTEWTHLALVRDGGVSTVYVNGVATYSTTSGLNAPTGGVGIGGNSLTAGTELFDGAIDEVRFFSFAPGAFSVDDLNLAPPPPPAMVPSMSWLGQVLLGLGLAGLALIGLGRSRSV